jgi:5-methylcytosine-specific restriction endonuclease McrA
VPLRVDNKATFIRTFWGRYTVQIGKRVYPVRWKRKVFETFKESQQNAPVCLLSNGKRTLWYFHDRFYWDDDGLEAEDIKALILQRERRLQHQVQTARSLMRAEEAGRPTRIPIPSELRRAVFERDGGRCVECGSNFDLQYDHVLPVAHGGATTLENLQLLCADCNRRKSDTL